MNNDLKFYRCECGSELIILEPEESEKIVELSFFRAGCLFSSMTFKQKLRWCWQILRYGTPFTDMVILNKENAQRLGNDLLEIFDK